MAFLPGFLRLLDRFFKSNGIMENCKNYFVTLQLDIMISWKKKKKNSILGHTHQWEMSHFFSLIFPMNVYHSITSLCNLKSWNTMLYLWQNWKKICIFNLQFNNNVFQFPRIEFVSLQITIFLPVRKHCFCLQIYVTTNVFFCNLVQVQAAVAWKWNFNCSNFLLR